MAQTHEAARGARAGSRRIGSVRPAAPAPGPGARAIPPLAANASGVGAAYRLARGLAVGAGLGLALAACSTDNILGPQTGGSAGGVQSTPGKLVVGSGPDALEYDCPSVTVRTGAATWQVADSSGGLRYQGNMGQLARECAIVGGNMTVKVGIEGRLLLGDKGTPGSFKVPMRVAVVNEGPTPEVITTKFFTIPLDIPQGQNQASFTVVEDQISFPLLKKPEQMERYIIYVGYDPKGTPAEKPAPQARRSTPKPSSSASSSSKPSSGAASSDPGAPKSDVFGPPPSSNSSGGGFTPPPSSGGFSAPPSTSTFSPPPG